MYQRQVRSLDRSIWHWELVCCRVESSVKRHAMISISIHSDECECCRVFSDPIGFYESRFNRCGQCPVALCSGRRECRGTPWDHARDALYNYESKRIELLVKNNRSRLDRLGQALLDACLLEYFFLLFVRESLQSLAVQD